MKEICCIDCEYYYESIQFIGDHGLRANGYCQKGTVLVQVLPYLEHDCDDFKPFIEDI